MPQARDHGATRAIPEPSRRNLLTGASAALVAGAAAFQKPGPLPWRNGPRPTEPVNPDAELIALADRIMALEAISDRLGYVEDQIEDWAEKARFNAENIRPLTGQHFKLMDQFVPMSATTLEGFRAKARVLQRFNNCAPGYADPGDPDALAWSLANDLLGVASVWAAEEGEHVA